MIFHFSDTQRMLRESLSRFLASRAAAGGRSTGSGPDERSDPRLWRALAGELGILGAALPEELGGSGGGPVENLIVMEELGAALARQPYIEAVVLCGGLLAALRSTAAEQLVPRLVKGDAVLALACGDPFAEEDLAKLLPTADVDDGHFRLHSGEMLVPGARLAAHLLVAARTPDGLSGNVSLFLVDPSCAGIAWRDIPGPGSGLRSIAFDGLSVARSALIGEQGAAQPLLELALDQATAASCAEAIGLLRELLSMTTSYIAQRRQFGEPLSSFQALRHRIADMYIAFEQCRGLALKATLLLDRPPQERAVAVSQAKVAVGRACRFVGQNAVQLHGGIGLTAELPAARYFARATDIENEFGSVDFHLRRLERLAAPSAGSRADRNAGCIAGQPGVL